MWEKWYIDCCLCRHQSLITFVNKHLNKLNLEVTELETQVWKCQDYCLSWIESHQMCILHLSVLDVVQVVIQSVCLWPVCWRSVPGSADGAAGGLLCPSVQLLPHPGELWAEGGEQKETLSFQLSRFLTTQKIKTHFSLCIPIPSGSQRGICLWADAGRRPEETQSQTWR